ncbi:MAG TPA: hypothetical protein VKK79_13695 [Candidatus Lokiarchaeia archaeon]|nr:hypothetical protein [Candidatus Lokiarchaeia archaeon]
MQDPERLIITSILGSPTNVIGLPISKLREALFKFGIKLLAGEYSSG